MTYRRSSRIAPAVWRCLRHQRFVLAGLFAGGLLASAGAAQGPFAPRDAPHGPGVAAERSEGKGGDDGRARGFEGGSLIVEPQGRVTSEQARRGMSVRLQRMRERHEARGRRVQDEERPRWFEVPDPPEGVDAPPAPDAVDGEITIQRLQEEMQ